MFWTHEYFKSKPSPPTVMNRSYRTVNYHCCYYYFWSTRAQYSSIRNSCRHRYRSRVDTELFMPHKIHYRTVPFITEILMCYLAIHSTSLPYVLYDENARGVILFFSSVSRNGSKKKKKIDTCHVHTRVVSGVHRTDERKYATRLLWTLSLLLLLL